MKKNWKRRVFLSIGLALLNAALLSAAIPSGYYYFAKNKKKAELKTALHLYSSPFVELEYGGGAGYTWEGFYKTDNRNDTVIDMYSDSIRKFKGYNAVSGMHIEHSFPKSWWGGYENGAYKDLFHLYPADGITNSTKNDLPLGEVAGIPGFFNGVTKIGRNGFGTAYSGNCFEPADEFKGDFARSYFYISTIYENLYPLWQSPMLNNNIWPMWKPWAIDLLLKWNKQDPVSSKERTRQEVVYGIQGNRNPFIDYPDLAEYIWGSDTTKTYPFPDETGAFLVSPRKGTKIDFGVILQTNNRKTNLHVQAVNISSSAGLKVQNNTTFFSVSLPTVPKDSLLKGKDIEISFQPTSAGEFRDTLLLSGAGLADTLRIPIYALASSDFITLTPDSITPIGGILRWIQDPDAVDYHLKLYQGDQEAGDLIISGYEEGSSWNKAIQLFNGTKHAVDLSRYSLQKQSNGSGLFTNTLKLNGNLAPMSTYTIVHKQAGASLMAKANIVTDSLLQLNGNDAVRLLRSGVTIDMVGVGDGGADVYWGQDLGLRRKSFVTHPHPLFSLSEWNAYPMDSIAFLSDYTMQLSTNPSVVLLDTYTNGKSCYDINNLKPQTTATYSVEAIKSGGNVKALNTMQITTSALDIPEVLTATDVTSTSFTARWETSDFATSYKLKLFSLKGTSDITETEGFPSVETNGKPLPTDWSGTASGNYETASSAGVAIPSIGLKNNGEWLQTKNYGSPVTSLTFMYRFPSAATGSSFLLDALTGTNWIRVDSIPYRGTTAKTYPSYSFTGSQNINAFRFTYKKSAGNLALDDIQVKYGQQDTLFYKTNENPVTDEYIFTNASPNTTYYYKVSALRDEVASAWSETVKVQTLLGTESPTTLESNPKVYVANDNIYFTSLKKGDIIRVFNLTGVCIKSFKANSERESINFVTKGLFIVNISSNERNFTTKILK